MLGCPDPKATPARANTRHCQPECAAWESPCLCHLPLWAMSIFPSSVPSLARSHQLPLCKGRGNRWPDLGTHPWVLHLLPLLGLGPIHLGTEQSAGVALA